MIKQWMNKSTRNSVNKSNRKYCVVNMKKCSSQKAITLIALIITIIVLLILAGITINIIIGKGGLLEKATKSGEIYSEESAKERLEIVLADLQADKYIQKDYNKNEYIDNELEKENMVVVDNIVIVDDWKFEIDRNVPKIVTGLGKGEQNHEIQIEAKAQIREDYVNANLQINITYEGTISQIKVKGENMEIPSKVENIYELEKEITENGIYTIYVKDEEGNYKIGKIEVTDITEDMDIWNKQDMENFRDKVNSGRTFEGRTARVMADIDLEGTEQNQWVPIGTENVNFKGRFEGNYHTINGVYIKNSNNNQALFRTVVSAIIKNIKIDNSYIQGTYNIGALFGDASGVNLEECVIGKNVIVYGTSKNSWGTYVGGFCGIGSGNIRKCINYAQIKSYNMYAGGIGGVLTDGQIDECANYGNISSSSKTVGGIVGCNINKININNSYNVGSISGSSEIGGIAGTDHSNGAIFFTNCYNIGTLTGGSYKAQIIGRLLNASKSINCYGEGENFNAISLGEFWRDDIQNDEGTWKYNNGYPILKWQVEH